MKHYILDGYNALFKIKPLLKKPYQTRDGFIQYIKVSQPFGSIKNKVSVVFDGKAGVVSEIKPSHSFLNVFFSKNESADDMIVRIVKKERNQSETIVVTDDREVKEKVKLLGCSTLSVFEFFNELTRVKNHQEKEKPDLNSKEGKNITEEMKKIWGISEEDHQ